MSSIEVRDEGQIRWIALNRQEKRNAIDLAMSQAVTAAPGDAQAALRADRLPEHSRHLRRGRRHRRAP